jgi:hypothetical protein
MRLAGLTAVVLASLVVAPAAHALPAPKKLRPFLLRVDEPVATTFARTPSFSWSPTRGARTYEFELATSPRFTEQSMVWTTETIKSPVTTIPVTLPWMSGTPYGFYARVRARTKTGLSRWSAPFGFNMRWPTVPAALPDHPGLVRWSTVEGATAYHVWYVDAGKVFTTRTNVADQREFYAFHQEQAWSGTVRWRVRAARVLQGTIKNELPAVSYGPWSPVFTHLNPAIAPGGIALTAMASDVMSSSPAQAHRLTPGFAFAGSAGLFGGAPYEFYRVAVSTDRDCVNVIYRGAITGGPAWAPRSTGPLNLPKNGKELAAAFGTILKDGSEGETFAADGFGVKTNEEVKPPGAETPTGGGGTSLPADQTVIGSLVDLWDTGWPSSRFYWTVLPVYYRYFADEDKVRWYEAEVPQDACAAGRVLSFGKLSEPVLTRSTAPYVSGLTPDGRLAPAKRTRPAFYGVPVAAWLPALGADMYEVQWSKKTYPWKPEGNVVTPATAAELPMKPGLWYYRVRGLSSTLPAGARQLAWSEPVPIRISTPRFKVVRGGKR